MSALRRVLGAPVLWVSLVHLYWGIAAGFAAPVDDLVRAALGDHTVQGPGGLLPAALELFADNPTLGPAIGAAVITAVILSALLGLISVGGVIARLAGERGVAVGFANAIRHAPAIAVIAVYGLVPRALCGLLLGLLPVRGWPITLLILALWSLCTAGEGLTRASVVLEGGAPWHPRRLVRGFRDAVQQPSIWVKTALLTAAAAAVTLATLMILTRTLGQGSVGLWAARGLTIISVGLGLWRTAIFVDAIEARRGRAR